MSNDNGYDKYGLERQAKTFEDVNYSFFFIFFLTIIEFSGQQRPCV